MFSKGSLVQFPEQEAPPPPAVVAAAAIVVVVAIAVPSSLGLYDFEGPRKYVFVSCKNSQFMYFSPTAWPARSVSRDHIYLCHAKITICFKS